MDKNHRLASNGEIKELSNQVETVLEEAFDGEDILLGDELFKCKFKKSEDGKLNFSLSTKDSDEYDDDKDTEYWYELKMSKLITGKYGELKYDHIPEVPDGIESRLSGR